MSALSICVLASLVASVAVLGSFVRRARREDPNARMRDLQSMETRDWRTSGSSE